MGAFATALQYHEKTTTAMVALAIIGFLAMMWEHRQKAAEKAEKKDGGAKPAVIQILGNGGNLDIERVLRSGGYSIDTEPSADGMTYVPRHPQLTVAKERRKFSLDPVGVITAIGAIIVLYQMLTM